MKNLKALIPYPTKVEVTSDKYFNFSVSTCTLDADTSYADLFRSELRKYSYSVDESKDCQVTIQKTSRLATEAYHLIIDNAQIRLEIASETGLFYALQTLKQLLYLNKG